MRDQNGFNVNDADNPDEMPALTAAASLRIAQAAMEDYANLLQHLTTIRPGPEMTYMEHVWQNDLPAHTLIEAALVRIRQLRVQRGEIEGREQFLTNFIDVVIGDD